MLFSASRSSIFELVRAAKDFVNHERIHYTAACGGVGGGEKGSLE